MSVPPSVKADRERIAAIASLPEAQGRLLAAVKLAIEGATVEDARVVLQIAGSAMTPDEVAATVNGKKR
jgi:hypothetical protein